MYSFQSTLITASAGSGKTYQLALRFLALCALGVDPTRINALTFTKKAAGEFKDRILKQLAEGAQSEAAAAQLATQLLTTIHGITENGVVLQPALVVGDIDIPEMNQAFFNELLSKLIANYSRLSLSTFDSFFQKIAKILAPELGLQKLQMISPDQQTEIRNKVLDEVLLSCNTDALYTAFHQVVLSRESDRIDQTLGEFIKNLHEQYCNNKHPEQWAEANLLWGEGTPTGGPLLNDEELAQELDNLTRIWDNLPPPNSRAEQWKTTRSHFIQELRNCLHTKSLPSLPSSFKNSQLLEELKNNTHIAFFYKQETPSSPELQNSLYKILSSYYNRSILDRAASSKGIYQLLQQYDNLYEQHIRQQGLMCFHDISNLLLSQEGEDSWISEKKEDIAFRLDGWYDHWMLDEFQDTNLTQWQIIKPFLEEIHQYSDRSLFIVGDEKQSIYGFRHAERRLIHMLLSTSPWKDFLKPWHMDTSWRSSQKILDFVNTVCDLKQSPLLSENTIARWHFTKHHAAKEIAGAVDVLTLDQDENYKTAISHELERLRLKDNGWTCSILVQTNKEAQKIAEWLRSPEGGQHDIYLASDSQIGIDSPLGNAFSSYITWLCTPEDNFALQHIRNTPLNIILHNNPSHAWMEGHRIFGEQGITGLLHYIRTALTPILEAFHLRRIEQWIVRAEEMDSRGCTLQEWKSYFDEMTYAEAQNPQSIRIMTIHKAKGLEDDIIIIPIIQNKAFDALQGDFWLQKKEENDGTLISQIWSPSEKAILASPELAKVLIQRNADEQLNGLSKLYVAITRAKRQLSIILPKDAKKTKNTKDSNELKASFKDIILQQINETNLSRGDLQWFLDTPQEKPEPNPAKKEPPISTLTASHPLRKKRSPSEHEHASAKESSTDSALALDMGACDFGTKVHALFEKITWLEPSASLPSWLIESTDAVAQSVRSCLESESVRQEFAQPSHDTKLWREQHLAGIINGEWVSGFLDRATLDGNLLSIIDFKTTRASAEELAERYAEQLEDYATLLKNALHQPTLQIRKVIISTHLNQAIEV